jgi:hypothetical protein
LVRKVEGQRPLGRPGPKWEDNIEMYIREIRWSYMDWIHLAYRDQWRTLVKAAMKLEVS